MQRCDHVRPLLYRSVEREVHPAEAIAVARHLSRCTACKILLARERRLAKMLEQDLPDLPVGEDFVRSVMATLPEGPPPRRARRARSLKLAGWAGTLVALGGVARTLGPGDPAEALRIARPQLELAPGDGGLPAWGELARWVLVAVDAFAGAPWQGVAGGNGIDLTLTVLLGGALGLLAASTVVVVAAGSLLRAGRTSA